MVSHKVAKSQVSQGSVKHGLKIETVTILEEKLRMKETVFKKRVVASFWEPVRYQFPIGKWCYCRERYKSEDDGRAISRGVSPLIAYWKLVQKSDEKREWWSNLGLRAEKRKNVCRTCSRASKFTVTSESWNAVVAYSAYVLVMKSFVKAWPLVVQNGSIL